MYDSDEETTEKTEDVAVSEQPRPRSRKAKTLDEETVDRHPADYQGAAGAREMADEATVVVDPVEFEKASVSLEDAQKCGYSGRRPIRPDYSLQGVTSDS
jgi:hypothetical protein